MPIARMQQRTDSAADWTNINPVLETGEIGFDETAKRFKVGDGVTPWVTLPYADAAEQAELAQEAAEAAATAAGAAQVAAEDAAAAAELITGLTGEDDAVALLVSTAGTDTYDALTTRLEAYGMAGAVAATYPKFANSSRKVLWGTVIGTGIAKALGASRDRAGFAGVLLERLQGAFPSPVFASEHALDYLTGPSITSEASGVRMMFDGFPGTLTSGLTAQLQTDNDWLMLSVIGPTVVFHVLGDEDYAQGLPPATFKAALTTYLSQVDAQIASGGVSGTNLITHVIVAGPARGNVPTPAYPWQAYVTAMSEVASALGDQGIFVNALPAFEAAEASGPGAADPQNLIAANNVDLTDGGHALLAGVVANTLRLTPASAASSLLPEAFDRFARADAQRGTSEAGQVYESIGATTTWVISGFGAGAALSITGTVTATGHRAYVLNTGLRYGVEVSALVVAETGGPGNGVTMNMGTATTSGLSLLINSSTNRIQLLLGEVLLATVDPSTLGVYVTGGRYHHLVLRRDGQRVIGYLDGTMVVTHNLTSGEAATLDGQTRHGIRCIGVRPSARWSHLAITAGR